MEKFFIHVRDEKHRFTMCFYEKNISIGHLLLYIDTPSGFSSKDQTSEKILSGVTRDS